MKTNKVLLLIIISSLILLSIYSSLMVNPIGELPSSTYSNTGTKIEVIAAGVPKFLGETRNYDLIFTELREGGFTAYMPFSQYVELPEAKSLDSDIDFYLPCAPNAPQWEAMRKNNIKLLIPGYVIFDNYFESMNDNDPLAELIECVGREHVLGVLNYDEPAGPMWAGSLSKKDLLNIYQRTKNVDPSIPVLMVHGPFYASNIVEGYDEPYPRQKERDKFFDFVKEASTFADVVGFDIYPVPFGLGGGITSPSLNGEQITNIKDTYIDYLDWIKREVPGKNYFTAVQGFNFVKQFEEGYKPDNLSDSDMLNLREPTQAELQDMVDGSLAGGASMIVWWGQTHITDKDSNLWKDIKTVNKTISE